MARRGNNQDEDNNQNVNQDPNVALLQTLIATLQGLQQQNHTQNAPPDPAAITANVIGQFRKYKPPIFDGKGGPAIVEEWLRGLDRIFTHIVCGDEHKISCATFQMIEDADHWWEAYKRTRTQAQLLAMTWEEFKELVMEKYFPQSYRDRKETEFLELKQRNLSVEEYERKFNELSRFAVHLVDTDAKKASRFERGLRSEIGSITAGLALPTYAGVVRCAQTISSRLDLETNYQGRAGNDRKRSWNEDRSWSPTPNKEAARKEDESGTNSNNTRTSCDNCGKNHKGECLLGKGVCYRCKMTDHQVENCPRRRTTR